MSRPLALIVEDEQMLAEIFSTALQMAGFATESILNGRAAVERLAEITPVLVLLDLHLPGVPGPDILRRIRADERLSHTRVIIVSADAAKAEIHREAAENALLHEHLGDLDRGFVQLLPIAWVGRELTAQKDLPTAPAQLLIVGGDQLDLAQRIDPQLYRR